MSKKTRNRSISPKESISAEIVAGESGEWILADQFLAQALQMVETSVDPVIDVDGLNTLDASALQILLAFHSEMEKRGRQLVLKNTSQDFEKWIEISGVMELLHCTAANGPDSAH